MICLVYFLWWIYKLLGNLKSRREAVVRAAFNKLDVKEWSSWAKWS